MKKNLHSKLAQAGFSLLEVVIAAGVLAVSVVSIMSLALYTQKNSQYLLEKTYAAIKASEGLELARWKRDHNLIDEDPATVWNSDLIISSANQSFTVLPLIFNRQVELVDSGECLPVNNCQTIKSTVEWGSNNQVEIETQLTNWRLDSLIP